MRICHFHITGVAWSNFKTGLDVDKSAAIHRNQQTIIQIKTLHIVNAGARVNETVVVLKR